jgi:hypothetical protein
LCHAAKVALADVNVLKTPSKAVNDVNEMQKRATLRRWSAYIAQ